MPVKPALADLFSLSGRVALVTGAGRGIGAAIAERLAEAGATVAATDTGDNAAVTAKTIAAAGGRAAAFELDVTVDDAVHACFDRVEAELGPVEVLVNNAGIFPWQPFLTDSKNNFEQVMEVNVGGAYSCSRRAATSMIEAGRGVIVNLCSIQSSRGFAPGLSAYTASKHALAGLTKSLAIELGPHGIRVLAVAPGITMTPGGEEAQGAMVAAGTGQAEALGEWITRLPLGRPAVPDDIARVVTFAASDLASLMTGTLISVDAGASPSESGKPCHPPPSSLTSGGPWRTGS